ncbi:MAG UNVERIFIED_CONTAM: DUF2670 domain-containing protein [Rickettsiaceae bacterium]|jgi:hypothetical protein
MIFKRILSNPMGIFVYGILSKWYVLVMVSTMIVTFWVFKGLEKAGVIEIIDNQLKKGFTEAQAVAQHCVPKILNLADMWKCIENPPAYVPGPDELALIESTKNDAANNVEAGKTYGESTSQTQPANPYDDGQ